MYKTNEESKTHTYSLKMGIEVQNSNVGKLSYNCKQVKYLNLSFIQWVPLIPSSQMHSLYSTDDDFL